MPIASIDAVDCLHEASPLLLLFFAHGHHQVRLKRLTALQVLHEYSRLGQRSVRSEDALYQRKRGVE